MIPIILIPNLATRRLRPRRRRVPGSPKQRVGSEMLAASRLEGNGATQYGEWIFDSPNMVSEFLGNFFLIHPISQQVSELWENAQIFHGKIHVWLIFPTQSIECVCVCCFTHEQKNMMLDSPRFPEKKKQLTKWSKSTSSYPAGFLWIKRRRLSLATNHVLVAPNIEVKWGHTYLSWIIKCLANSFTNKNAPTFNCCLHRYFTDTVRN